MTNNVKNINVPLDKYIKNIFSINYDNYKYYQPNIVEIFQSRISKIDISKHNYKTKLNIIYSTLLEHLSHIFFNSSMFLSNLTPLTSSVREFLYLNNMDIFILKNKNTKTNKYVPLLKKQNISEEEIRYYSIFCEKLQVNISDIPTILQLVSFTLTDSKKDIVFHRIDGAYPVFKEKFKSKYSNTKHIIFKIFAYGSFCSLIYYLESNTIDFLYSDYEENKVSFSDQVLYVLSKSIFKLNLEFTSFNFKNIDDEQFEESYIFIKDIKIWLCLFLFKLSPSLDIETILEYINILPYHLRDILYLNIVEFIFEKSTSIKNQNHDYSDLIKELMEEEKTYITGVPSETVPKSQSGGSLYKNKKEKTNQLIRNLFFIR